MGDALAAAGGGKNKAPTCTIDSPSGDVSIATGQSVNFSGTVTDPENNTPFTYSWVFPNGTPAGSNVEDPGTVSWNTAGTYTVSFTASDSLGATCAQQQRTVTVNAAGSPHASLTATDANGNGYLDSKDITIKCLACHTDNAKNLFHSVHYQWTGLMPNVTNLPSNTSNGKDINSLNSYCGSIETSPWFTCIGCHSGNGGTIDHTVAFGANPPSAQLENIDCMMCHQETYVREGRSEGTDPFQDYAVAPRPDGLTSIEIPYFDRPFIFTPNVTAMGGTVGVEAAMRSVHKTTRKTCLRCHAGAAGSDGGKRGDMSSVSGSPSLSTASDFHVAPVANGGAGLVCSTCHSAGNHRVKGRGIDLRPTERDLSGNFLARNTCTDSGCHAAQPHGDYTADYKGRDRHAGRVACQNCHIPTFAKDISTEMTRDWTHPHWSSTACNGRGGWIPGEVRQQNAIPKYGWFDGTSQIYQLGQKPTPVQDQGPLDAAPKSYYRLAIPNGGVNSQAPSPIAKLYPLKIYTGLGARVTSGTHTGELVAPSTFIYFTQASDTQPVGTGWERAVREGMLSQWGTNTYSFETVNTMEYQTLNHGVASMTSALSCGACHDALRARNDPPARINLKANFGYGLRTGTSIITGQQLDGTANTVCTQCHTLRSVKSFAGQHDGHVGNRRFDCSVCHNLSRPEQGLRTSL